MPAPCHSELCDLGAHASCSSLESGGARCVVRTLFSSGRSWQLGGSLLIIWHSAGGGVCGESVSQPLLLDSVWVFSQSSDLEA